MHSYLATAPFDIYELHLFLLLAREKNFTRAAQVAGLTQSALTRQIQGMESRLGRRLLERTTRRFELTPAGELLAQRAAGIIEAVGQTLEDLRVGFDVAPKVLKVGLCKTIGHAYLPGFFVHFRRDFPDVQVQVAQHNSGALLSQLENRDIDVAIVSNARKIIPRAVAHQFQDEFTLIVPIQSSIKPKAGRLTVAQLAAQSAAHPWVLLSEESSTGVQLRRWLKQHRVAHTSVMELDDFDLIINLVSLGLGISIVPNRSLPLYLRTLKIRKVPLESTFARTVTTVIRPMTPLPTRVQNFVERILF